MCSDVTDWCFDVRSVDAAVLVQQQRVERGRRRPDCGRPEPGLAVVVDGLQRLGERVRSEESITRRSAASIYSRPSATDDLPSLRSVFRGT